MRNFSLALIALSVLVGGQLCAAKSADDLRNKKLACEGTDGNLQATELASDADKADIASINAARKVQYESIAQKNGTSVEAVRSSAAKDLRANSPC